MSIRIDEYISSTGAISDLMNQQKSTGTDATEVTEQRLDAYISGTEETTEPIPCENYNDILQVMRKADAQKSQEEASTENSGQPAGGTGTGGSEEEEETTTKMVTVNGVTYLETTTVSDGVTTVIRSVIEGQNLEEEELLPAEETLEQLEEATKY